MYLILVSLPSDLNHPPTLIEKRVGVGLVSDEKIKPEHWRFYEFGLVKKAQFVFIIKFVSPVSSLMVFFLIYVQFLVVTIKYQLKVASIKRTY